MAVIKITHHISSGVAGKWQTTVMVTAQANNILVFLLTI